MQEAPPENRDVAAEMVKEFYLRYVCEELAVPLGQAVERWLGSASLAVQPFVPEPVVKKAEKEVEKLDV